MGLRSLDLASGTVVAGDFKVLHALAQGGMGVVYVVEQLSTGKQRALKLMRADLASKDAVRRFEQEARVGSQIKSEHVVDVIAAGIERGAPWLAMELLQGEALDGCVQRQGPMEADQAAEILEQLCHAVAAAHDIRVVHRDLKPENVFLAEHISATSRHLVKVLDFGIAKVVEHTLNTTEAVGSPLWMAPEQTSHASRITPAADVWAIGLIAFWLLTGRSFWRAGNIAEPELVALLREITLDPIPLASERGAELSGPRLPEGFDPWFVRCVVRDPRARFQHAREAWHALAPVLGRAMLNGAKPGGGAGTCPRHLPEAETMLASASRALTPLTSTGPPPVSSFRRRMLVGLVVGGVVLLSGVGFLVAKVLLPSGADQHGANRPPAASISESAAPRDVGSAAESSAATVPVPPSPPIEVSSSELAAAPAPTRRRPTPPPGARPQPKPKKIAHPAPATSAASPPGAPAPTRDPLPELL